MPLTKQKEVLRLLPNKRGYYVFDQTKEGITSLTKQKRVFSKFLPKEIHSNNLKKFNLVIFRGGYNVFDQTKEGITSLTKQKRVFSKFLPKEIHKIKIYQEMIYNKSL